MRISAHLTFPHRVVLLAVAIFVAQAGLDRVLAQTLGQSYSSSYYDGLSAYPRPQPFGGLPAYPPPYGGLPPPPQNPDETAKPDVIGPTPRAQPEKTGPNWLVTPYAALREAYTDNVRLTPHGASDFITSTTAGAAVQGKTRRLKTALDGNVTYDAYARASDLDGYRYNFYGNGLGEIVDDTLFLDMRSSISAQPINANGAVSAFDRSLPNQVQVINTSVSPYLVHDLGSWASGELRYRASMLDYSSANTPSQTQSSTSSGLTSANLNNSFTNQVLANLRAGPQFTTLRWAVDGAASNTDYENGRTVKQGTSTLTGEYAVMREWALLAKVGEDSFKDSAVSTSDNFHPSWRLGTRLTPGPRTDFLVEGGRRFGGPYWSGQLRYRVSKAMTLSASHDETIGTQQELLNSGLNQLVRDDQGRLVDPLTGDIVNPNATAYNFVGQSFSLKTNRIALSGVDGRNTYNISAEYDERVIGVTSLGQSGQEHQSVLLSSGSVTRQLTRVSDASIFLAGGRIQDSLDTGSYKIFRVGTAYDYDLSPTLRGTLAYWHYTLSNNIGTGYGENAILASVRKRF